jgi:hypothetical protein
MEMLAGWSSAGQCRIIATGGAFIFLHLVGWAERREAQQCGVPPAAGGYSWH